jgi:hypothetical protein
MTTGERLYFDGDLDASVANTGQSE